MRAGSKLVLVAAAAVAVLAANRPHFMDVALPDGSVARVHYVGHIAPRISVTKAPASAVAVPVELAAVPTSLVDGVTASLNREIAAMLHTVFAAVTDSLLS